jgi:hypothetical protein
MKTMTKAFTSALLPALAVCSTAAANGAWAPASATLTCSHGTTTSLNIQLEEFNFTTSRSTTTTTGGGTGASKPNNTLSFRVRAQDFVLLGDGLTGASLGECTLATTLVDSSGTVTLKWITMDTIVSKVAFHSDDTDKESRSGISASLAFSSVVVSYTAP